MFRKFLLVPAGLAGQAASRPGHLQLEGRQRRCIIPDMPPPDAKVRKTVRTGFHQAAQPADGARPGSPSRTCRKEKRLPRARPRKKKARKGAARRPRPPRLARRMNAANCAVTGQGRAVSGSDARFDENGERGRPDATSAAPKSSAPRGRRKTCSGPAPARSPRGRHPSS